MAAGAGQGAGGAALELMVEQVLSVCPGADRRAVRSSLRRTNSVDVTAGIIFDGGTLPEGSDSETEDGGALRMGKGKEKAKAAPGAGPDPFPLLDTQRSDDDSSDGDLVPALLKSAPGVGATAARTPKVAWSPESATPRIATPGPDTQSLPYDIEREESPTPPPHLADSPDVVLLDSDSDTELPALQGDRKRRRVDPAQTGGTTAAAAAEVPAVKAEQEPLWSLVDSEVLECDTQPYELQDSNAMETLPPLYARLSSDSPELDKVDEDAEAPAVPLTKAEQKKRDREEAHERKAAEKVLREIERQRVKADKLKERQRKKEEKAAEKEEAQRLARLERSKNRRRTPEERISEMIVHVDEHLVKVPKSVLVPKLKAVGAAVTVEAHAKIRNSIWLARKICEFPGAPPSRVIEDPRLFVWIAGQDFVDRIRQHTLKDYIQQLLVQLADTAFDAVTLVIEGVAAVLRKERNQYDKVYKKRVQSGATGAGTTTPAMDPKQVEMALVWLQCEGRFFIRETTSSAETGELMGRFIRSIATSIDKQQDSGLSFCAEAARTNTQSEVPRIFRQQLQQFNLVSQARAEAIAAQYKSHRELRQAFVQHGKGAIENVKVRAGQGGGSSRKLGAALSEKLYQFYTATSGDTMLKSS